MLAHQTIEAFILAGGKSSRMGCNKALMRAGRQTMIEYVVEALRPMMRSVSIIAKDPALYHFPNVPVYKDCIELASPLIGIYTGLQNSRSSFCFFATCDVPDLEHYWIRSMIEHVGESDGICLRSRKGLEPFPSMYNRRIIPVIEKQIAEGQLSVRRLLEQIRIVDISVPHDFESINTPQQYEHWQNIKERKALWRRT
ncbi:MAG: molybdenum cofactor guanylyltransferase [Chlamydiota bacterium]|nr:molybdenum cofactor guanylyltransferase [Chlamydiota bacterium]